VSSRFYSLTIEECEFGRRLVWAVVLGCLIGWERKQADRPAGIRTMALVSLGSCLFSICSAFAFLSGPMAWDASRISAAIPSGVGFLGSALIFKHKDTSTNTHEVHGLTTAASVWLSAAVGIACAGGLYFVASLSTAIMLVLLRFGPRTYVPTDEEEEDEKFGNFEAEVQEAVAGLNAKKHHANYQALSPTSTDPEMQSMIPRDSAINNSHRSQEPRKRPERPSLL
jgi:putative Mg2+ transporter-C (MgtC) family protein